MSATWTHRIKTLIINIPLVLSIIFLLWIIFFTINIPENTEDIRRLNESTDKLPIDIIIELNKYLISIATALFGICGFFMSKYESNITTGTIGLAYVMALIILIWAYYDGFKVYSDLTNKIAQNYIALMPDKSKTLYYLEHEYRTCGFSCIILLSIFVSVLYNKK